MHRLKPIALGISLALFATGVQAGSFTGPQSSQTPYVVPTAAGWDVTSLITVGDSAKEVPYVLVGIPDGMGAVAGKYAGNGEYVADRAYMTVFLNHELGVTSGVALRTASRARSSRSGPFISIPCS